MFARHFLMMFHTFFNINLYIGRELLRIKGYLKINT